MIAANQPDEAVFKVADGNRVRETRETVVAWDDEGNALIADYKAGVLRAANHQRNFVRLESVRGPVVGIIPGSGWRAVLQDEDGTETISVLAWAFDANRYGTPLFSDEDGQVYDLQETPNLVRLIPPEVEAD